MCQRVSRLGLSHEATKSKPSPPTGSNPAQLCEGTKSTDACITCLLFPCSLGLIRGNSPFGRMHSESQGRRALTVSSEGKRNFGGASAAVVERCRIRISVAVTSFFRSISLSSACNFAVSCCKFLSSSFRLSLYSACFLRSRGSKLPSRSANDLLPVTNASSGH